MYINMAVTMSCNFFFFYSGASNIPELYHRLKNHVMIRRLKKEASVHVFVTAVKRKSMCNALIYPVIGRKNFPRQNLSETIAEPVSRKKKKKIGQ